ncbi:PIN domain-containing protein [Halapricum desulfuricans]|uniref:PIN domain containing protein n=1 Tax=Halapricum desulfuricans TaxID=2841257 RepID=A0A897NZJ1_9EURY|nr:PIN domain-containing protein [Halapricum desulfuricans]QSG15999.1 PIN domain containing protein [Halapricum desulfuricans]
MTDYVFDTEPLIAYFYDEPGASDVTERLTAIDNDEATGALSHATATELVYKIARLETGDPNHVSPGDDEFDVGEHDLRILRGYGITIETPPWHAVARIKGAGGISLGDSYAAALALASDATLVIGGDPEFGDLPVDVSLHSIRDGSV